MLHEGNALTQGTEHDMPDAALPGAGEVVYEPEVAAIVEIEDGDVAVVVIHGEVAIVEVVVDQPVGVCSPGQRLQLSDECIVLAPDNGQLLSIGEAISVFPSQTTPVV